jgi:hypothetical protein
MHIDIQRWLQTLPSAKRGQVRNIILKHAPAVRAVVGSQPNYRFELPR